MFKQLLTTTALHSGPHGIRDGVQTLDELDASIIRMFRVHKSYFVRSAPQRPSKTQKREEERSVRKKRNEFRNGRLDSRARFSCQPVELARGAISSESHHWQ